MAFRIERLLLVTCLVPSLIGCGADDGGVKLANAEGVVTYNGAPLANANVMAYPEKGPLATGNTDSQGRFVLWTNERKGVAIGKIQVAVRVVSQAAGEAEVVNSSTGTTNDPSTSTQMAMQSMMKFNETQKKKGKKAATEKSPLDKYGDTLTSGLAFEIKSGTNDLNVSLK